MTIYKEMSYSWKRYSHFKTMKFFFNLTEFKHKHPLFVNFMLLLVRTLKTVYAEIFYAEIFTLLLTPSKNKYYIK